ncbi:MAG TPA: hypothetical protein VFZ97_10565 [Acidimicrobiales bacterium]
MTSVGIAVALAAAVANGFGVVLQAQEDRQAPLSRGGRPSLLIGLASRPRWLAGAGLMAAAWPAQVLALTIAPIAIVQPLLIADQLVLLAVARLQLGERIGRLKMLSAFAIVVGLAAVVWAAPQHMAHQTRAGRLGAPLLTVGIAALIAYVVARLRARSALSLVVGAGLAYAWVDFANNLLAHQLTGHHRIYSAFWLASILASGVLAFLQETSALQRLPATTVEPILTAIHQPLPVLMAFWAGLQVGGVTRLHLVVLIAGLALSTASGTYLGRRRDGDDRSETRSSPSAIGDIAATDTFLPVKGAGA